MSNILHRQMPIFLSVLIFASICSVASFNAAAQSTQGYPSRPIKLIAPVAAGGGLDNLARKVAERLSKNLGQPIVVENIGGGGGTIAAQTALKASPDGYTLMISYVATHGTNPAVRKLPYDAIKDFTPIGMIGATPNTLIINPDLPVKNLKEFIEYAKKSSENQLWLSGTRNAYPSWRRAVQACFQHLYGAYTLPRYRPCIY